MTRRTWLLVPGLAAAALLGACGDQGGSPAAPGAVQDPLVQRLIAMGARPEQIQDRGDHFVIEGDISVSKADLRAGRVAGEAGAQPGGPRRQRWADTLATSRRTIHVNLSAVDAENSSWAAATRAAMSNWSNVNGVNLSMVEGGTADVTVYFVNSLASCTVAQGAFPSSGAPGTTVQISRQYAGSYSYAKMVWIMTHELGHNIGLAHTDGAFGTLITGTPTSDGASVMNSGNTYGGCPPAAPSWSGFSSYDQIAVQRLYPLPYLSGLAATSSSGSVLLSWSANAGAYKYQVRRMEVYHEQNFYESTYWEYPTTGEWVDVYDTSWNTGTTWTGSSKCYWYQDNYEERVTDAWYEVRPVYYNGIGGAATVGSNDTC